MKKLLMAVIAVTFLLGVAAVAAPASYWDRFKSVFVDWDDNAPPKGARTQVTGVRGLNVEQALGSKGYDWQAVNEMENLTVTMEAEKAFLEEGKLGPFSPKGVKE